MLKKIYIINVYSINVNYQCNSSQMYQLEKFLLHFNSRTNVEHKIKNK